MPIHVRTRRRDLLVGGGAFLACALAGPPVAAVSREELDASELVRSLGEEILGIVSEPGRSQAERLTLIVRRLEPAIDLPLIGRLTLGRHWRALDASQQARFLESYRAYGIALMGQLLRGYRGETFEVLGARALKGSDSVVSSRFHRPAGLPSVRVDWRLRPDSQGSLKVIDLVAEGISLVVSQRDQFNAIYERDGFDGIIATLQARTGAVQRAS